MIPEAITAVAMIVVTDIPMTCNRLHSRMIANRMKEVLFVPSESERSLVNAMSSYSILAIASRADQSCAIYDVPLRHIPFGHHRATAVLLQLKLATGILVQLLASHSNKRPWSTRHSRDPLI
jgi:hypothetical protein